MTTSLKNIQKVSLLFFIGTGIIHFVSGAITYSLSGGTISQVFFKTSFIPFIICALIYAGSSLRINIDTYSNENSPKLDKIFLISGVAIILIVSILFFL